MSDLCPQISTSTSSLFYGSFLRLPRLRKWNHEGWNKRSFLFWNLLLKLLHLLCFKTQLA